MIAESGFVITIGDHGAVVALHKDNEIKNKIFLENLTEDLKKELARIFTINKLSPIYVLLDTADQGYRKKSYPFIKRSDLLKLIKRDMTNEDGKETLENFIILNPKKPVIEGEAKRWECLFVSSSIPPEISYWIEFLLEMPNRLVGIYMLPVESFNLYKLLKNHIRANSKIKNKKTDICCLIMQNKVGKTRQTVFCDEGIIFTRVIDYDFQDATFLEKYEQDVYSTFEYLKRPFPDLTLKELDVVNIFPAEILTKINATTNIDFNFVNYTPFQAACNVRYNSVIAQNSNFCDLLLSKIFFSSKKKILKFTTPKIAVLEKLFLIIRSSYYFNLILLTLISALCVATIYTYNFLEEEKSLAEIENVNAMQSLARLKFSLLDGEEILDEEGEIVDVDKILDIGKTYETFNAIGTNLDKVYADLKFVKDYGVKLTSFSYSLSNFNIKSPSKNNIYKVSIEGEITNKSGDIEDLLKEFDGLTLEFKKTFEGRKVSYIEPPRNIDFTKKHYNFPVQFSITNLETP